MTFALSPGGPICEPKLKLRTYTPSIDRVRDRIALGPVEATVDEMIAGIPDGRRMAWPLGFSQVEYPFPDNPGPSEHMIAATIGRKDALHGHMAEFWLNNLVPGHKAIGGGNKLASTMSLLTHFHDHALGNFEGLLKRFIGSVPLIFFMDNDINVAPGTLGPGSGYNENLGREILELFGLGMAEPNEAPRYDQVIDVEELSRVLTGWNSKAVDTPGALMDAAPTHVRGVGGSGPIVYANGVFTHNHSCATRWFYPERHDGDAAFFTFWPGVEFSNAVDGPGVAGTDMHPSLDRFLSLLVRHRPAARYQCRKIGRWFIGRDPSPLVREAMTNTFLDNVDAPDQIARVLKVLFSSVDFCGSYADDRRSLVPMAYYSKLMNFFGDAAFGFVSASKLRTFLRQEFYQTITYQSPSGYPDDADYWLSPPALNMRAENAQLIIVPAASKTNTNANNDCKADLGSWAAAKGFVTPRDFVMHIKDYWRVENEGPLLALFPTPDAPANWNLKATKVLMQDALRTVILTDRAHMAA